MEKILHRTNSLQQLQQAKIFRVHRIETDLHATRKGIIVSHDTPLGPFVIGKHGVVRSRTNIPLLRRKGKTVPFQSIMAQPRPLFLDLKGTWDTNNLELLSRYLHARERTDDIVASLTLDLVDFFAEIYQPNGVMYTLKRREQFARLHKKRIPDSFRGIAINAMAYNQGRDAKTVIRQMHNQHLLAYAWNIPDEETCRILRDQGCDGAIIDDPSWSW